MIWEKTQLSDLFKVGSSKRVLQSQWKSKGVPFYRGREITRLSTDGFVDNELFISEEHYEEVATKYGVPSEGDIVITAIGTIGNTHVVRASDQFYFKDASVLWLKKVAHVSSDFINLWLKSPVFFSQLDKGNGATVDTLTIKKLQSVQINLPSLPEQQRIVSILDEAFAGIATATANAEKNLANARELFNSHLQSVFESKGDGWIEKRVEACFNLKSGDGLTSKMMGKNGIYPVYGGNGIAGLHTHSNLSGCNVIIGRVGALCGNVRLINEKIWLTDNAFKVEGFNYEFEPSFLTYLLNFKNLRSYARQAAQPVISNSSLKDVLLNFPESISEQRVIASKFDMLSTETKLLEAIYQQKLNALTELKKSILNQAFSGQLQ